MKKEITKRIMSFIVGVVGTFFKMYGMILALVCVAIVFDVITGIASAKATHKKITSKKANEGFWKKMGLLLALFFGVFLDVFIPTALNFLTINLPFNMPFGLVFGCYIVFNESISICENLDKINSDILPHWVKSLLIGGAETIDKTVEDHEEENYD